MKRLLLLCIIILLAKTTSSLGQVYVNHAATGANNGTSWANAYTNLRTAIYSTSSGEIWVAQGTYRPTATTNRSVYFTLRNNVEIYGGFNGTETTRSQRDYENNATIMSGDIGVVNDATDNSNKVIYVDGSSNPINSTAILDGFTVRDGQDTDYGAGLHLNNSSPQISNCQFIKNAAILAGGAVYCTNNSNAKFTNVIFEDNKANFGAGALFCSDSESIVLDNCSFFNNSAFFSGAAVFGGNAIVTDTILITDCTFKNNYSTGDYGGAFSIGIDTDIKVINTKLDSNYTMVGNGGAIYNEGGNLTIINSKLLNNRAYDSGGAIFNEGNLTIINSLLYNNRVERNPGPTTIMRGGAIYNKANLQVYNSNLIGNSARTINGSISTLIGGIANDDGITLVKNTIFYFNIGGLFIGKDYGSTVGSTNTVAFSMGANLPASPTNTAGNPQFVTSSQIRLQSTSPAINAGDNSAIPAGINTDIEGNNRITGGTVDIGAYESDNCPFVTNNRIYVDSSNSSGNYDGLSWTTAFQDAQTALTFAQSCSDIQEIWVANGTYYPTTGTDRTISFQLKDNVAIYGGFAGTETELAQRNIQNNPTILSGDIGTLSLISDNTYHVVQSTSNNNTAILDGFIIEHGNANVSPNNFGAGYLGDASDAVIRNCTFRNNTAISGGGVLSRNASTPVFTNCIFHDNEATGSTFSFGGGALALTCTPTYINCLFYDNTAATGGGLTLIDATVGTVTNCTFSENEADFGGAIYNDTPADLNLTNSILWNNSATTDNEINNNGTLIVTYSIIEGGGYAGSGNLNQNPLFTDAANNDFSLSLTSPAIGNGDNSAVLSGITTDIIGNDRIVTTTVDIGAYEVTFCNDISNNRIYVNANNSGIENGTSWATAFTDLQTALEVSENFSCVQEIWVANGTYFPTSGTDRTISFELQDGVAIYGGFVGTETELSQRTLANNATILSGDIGILANNSDNAFHVVQGTSNNNTAILDGFIIEYGNANVNSTGTSRGGGYYGNASNAILRNCIFQNNQAIAGGGLRQENASSPQFINCVFRSNIAIGGSFSGGGGASLSDTSPAFINCLFYDNSAVLGGGLTIVFSPNTKMINCTFTENTATAGGGGVFGGNGILLQNTILWNNNAPSNKEISGSGVIVTYSIIEGGYVGTGNINQNPLFVGAPTGDYRLQCNSPAVNAGTPDTTGLNLGTVDLAKQSRISDSRIDIGAFEYQRIINVNIVNNIASGPELIKVEGILNANNTITSPQLIEYEAGKAIILNQGFEATNGAVFSAKIETRCL